MNEKQFIAEVIRALEDAEKNPPQPKKSAEAVAKEAWGKLQYDFPVSSDPELYANCIVRTGAA